MKNILHERPTNELSGRLAASALFVDDADIKNKTVLDIGCGYGWCELNFLGREVTEIIDMELSEQDLGTARENISDSRLSLAIGSGIAIPFPEQAFDTIVAWEVLEHIPKNTENKMFSEVYRVVKPGGIFYFSTPHASFWANIFDPAWWLIGHRHYSEVKLTQAAEVAGFTVLECSVKGGWWEIFGQLDMYGAKWIFGRRPFWDKQVQARQNDEYSRDGFSTVFMKLKKSASNGINA